MTKTRRQEAARAAANLAAEIGGAARGNLVELRNWTPARAEPPKPRKIGLRANGLDDSWTHQRPADPVERHVKKLSENLRRDLKKVYAQGEAKC